MIMKKIVCFTVIVFLFTCSMGYAQVQSLIQGMTGPGGQMRATSQYFASGMAEGVNYETRALSEYSLNGEFPKVVIYKAASGAYQSETLIQMQQGHMSTLEKVGSSTLVTFPDEHDQNKIHGIFTESAVGTSSRLIGQAQLGTAFATAGGLQMQSQLAFSGTSGNWKNGAVQRVTEGFGPAPGQVGEVGSQTTVYWEEHVNFGGFNPQGGIQYSGIYNVSMNPGFPVIPKP